MPTSAFFNLSKEKQEKILASARKEFSTKLFEDASINQIIKDIDMPRGTFYLYFENKEDIYGYLLMFFKNNFINLLISTLKKNNGNIFKTYINMFDLIMKKCDLDIQPLVNNIFINMNNKRLEKYFPKKDEKDKYYKILIDDINYDLLNISKNEVHVLISILLMLFFQNISCAFRNPDKTTEIKEFYIKQINIIRKGVEREDLC